MQKSMNQLRKKVSNMNIDDPLKKHETMLKSYPNVTAVGLWEKNGKEVIIIYTKQKNSM